MSQFETLNPGTRFFLEGAAPVAVRIIDVQAARIAELERQEAKVNSALDQALDLLMQQKARIVELERQASDARVPIVSDGGRCRYCMHYGRICAYHGGVR